MSHFHTYIYMYFMIPTRLFLLTQFVFQQYVNTGHHLGSMSS